MRIRFPWPFRHQSRPAPTSYYTLLGRALNGVCPYCGASYSNQPMQRNLMHSCPHCGASWQLSDAVATSEEPARRAASILP